MKVAGNAKEFPSVSGYCAFEVLVLRLATDRASVIAKQSFCLCGVPSFIPTITAYQGATFIKLRRREEELNREEENAAL